MSLLTDRPIAGPSGEPFKQKSRKNSTVCTNASAEYAGRQRNNTEYVSDLYYAFLRRGGDLSGVDYWVNRLDTGVEDREMMRRDFINSPEFSARIDAIIQQGC
jgi:hypothetical protein